MEAARCLTLTLTLTLALALALTLTLALTLAPTLTPALTLTRWTTHANRDTEHTKNFRAAKPVFGPGGGKNQLEPHGDPPRGGCDERSRPFTNWGPNCQLSLASERWC